MLPSTGGMKASCFFKPKQTTTTKTGTCKMQQQTSSHTAKHAAHSSLVAFLLSSPGPKQQQGATNQQPKQQSIPRGISPLKPEIQLQVTCSSSSNLRCVPIFNGARQFQPLNSCGARKDMGSAFNQIHSLQCISLLSSVSR